MGPCLHKKIKAAPVLEYIRGYTCKGASEQQSSGRFRRNIGTFVSHISRAPFMPYRFHEEGRTQNTESKKHCLFIKDKQNISSESFLRNPLTHDRPLMRVLKKNSKLKENLKSQGKNSKIRHSLDRVCRKSVQKGSLKPSFGVRL